MIELNMRQIRSTGICTGREMPDVTFTCLLCHKPFTTSRGMKQHIRQIHSDTVMRWLTHMIFSMTYRWRVISVETQHNNNTTCMYVCMYIIHIYLTYINVISIDIIRSFRAWYFFETHPRLIIWINGIKCKWIDGLIDRW